MSKYTEGYYVIAIFDERGTRIKSESHADCGLIAACNIGNNMVKNGECASFSVSRNLYNSLDHKDD